MTEDVFTALADPTRRRVLDLLAEHGHGTATTLAAELPVSRPAVIKHLAVLDRAGLVAAQRHGREVRYVVQSAPLRRRRRGWHGWRRRGTRGWTRSAPSPRTAVLSATITCARAGTAPRDREDPHALGRSSITMNAISSAITDERECAARSAQSCTERM